MRIFGLFAIIPASVLLTISFFVLVVAKKAETEGLKKFGRVVAILLWFAAAVVLSMGICILSNCCRPMGGMHCHGPWQHEGRWDNDKNENGEDAEGYEMGKGAGACNTMKGQMPGKGPVKEIKKVAPKK